eukprot:GHVR01044319.1.p2 GENE.GHVR01044319.1~~GHVR01044319.1.p2  ORF type:complete len:133 (+),score=11.01 GHVR01044319.1:8406-8804(+)
MQEYEKVLSNKVILYLKINYLLVLLQVFIEEEDINSEIIYKKNVKELTKFATSQSMIVWMESKQMKNELALITINLKPSILDIMKKKLQRMYLNDNNIETLEPIALFTELTILQVRNNKLVSLTGLEGMIKL